MDKELQQLPTRNFTARDHSVIGPACMNLDRLLSQTQPIVLIFSMDASRFDGPNATILARRLRRVGGAHPIVYLQPYTRFV